MKSSIHSLNHDRDVLSVTERVEAVLQLQKQERPNERLSVAEVCRRSGVSRANLYATHPTVVAAILGRTSDSAHRALAKERNAVSMPVRTASPVTSAREKSLLYLCVELQAEIQNLRSILGTDRVVKKSKG
jgi:hypothetical protein